MGVVLVFVAVGDGRIEVVGIFIIMGMAVVAVGGEFRSPG